MRRFWLETVYSLRVLKEIIFPRHCKICEMPIETGYVCECCRKNYLLQRYIKGIPREEYLARQAEPLATDILDNIWLLYKYEGVYKEAIHKIKFANESALLALLSEEADMALPTAKLRWLQQFDIITSIPTSSERLKQRGFDVPQEIFSSLCEQRSSCVYIGNVLERVRQTAPLYELNPEERRRELAGCFMLNKNLDVKGKHILLCDDIFTTGSTLTEAAEVLRCSGASKVSALALCAAQANW